MKERASAPMLRHGSLRVKGKRSGRRPRMVYIGVDLHRNRSSLVGLDEAGAVVLKRSIPSEPGAFRRVFSELEPRPIEVAFEATYGWGWFADLLTDAGVTGHMVHPLATKAIATARVKNDTVDARTLADLLRTHFLAEAWMAPLEVREARRLVRTRTALVRIRSRLKSQVHALLADHGVRLGVSDAFGREGRRLIAAVTLPAVSERRLAAHLRLIDSLAAEIALGDREIRDHFRGDDRIRRLTPIPGIGFLAAATITAEIWDVGRFSSPERSPHGPGSPRPNAVPWITSGAATSASRAAGCCAGS
jgi:transposase